MQLLEDGGDFVQKKMLHLLEKDCSANAKNHDLYPPEYRSNIF
jgi:hypothetical protein